MFLERAHVLDTVRSGFHHRPILVVGDLMLDRYLWGEVSRISPEAPVPVVRLQRESESSGGAGNVALNLAQLGLAPMLAGFVGDDADGLRLITLLERAGVNTAPLVATSDRPTITKTRIIGGHQQMLRLDREETGPPPREVLHQLLSGILARMHETQPAAVILSDYAKGVLSEEVCRELIDAARALRIPVLVDPKGNNYRKYQRATVLSPNRAELAAALGMSADSAVDGLLAAAPALKEKLGVDFLTVTLSERGIALVDETGLREFPAMAREVFDVSGAGDTVIATLAAGLAAGLSRLDAVHLANIAAGVVVGKVGTTPILLNELLHAITTEEALEQSGKLCALDTAATRVATWRKRGERIVFTNGCFDLLHAGHVTYLEQARQQGNRLVVGLNTDRSITALKGPNRPLVREDDRARVLAALAAVDLVILFDEETPLHLIRALRPDVLVKGADYTEAQVVGGAEVKSWGGRVFLAPLMEGRSTTRLVERINEADPSAPAQGE